jgi:hypothetical protein
MAYEHDEIGDFASERDARGLTPNATTSIPQISTSAPAASGVSP